MPRIVRTQYEYEGRMREQITVVEEDDLPRWGREAKLAVVGRPHPRVDGHLRVTGAARYTADVYLPGMLYCKIVRSPHARARVLSIDASRALALPGVRLVLTPDDFPEGGPVPPPLSRDVRFQGEEVAAVVAEDEETASDAAALVEVEYEVLPPLLSWEKALESSEPVATARGNVHEGDPQVKERGDPERGFAEADLVLEETYTTQTELHNALEPHGAVAWWDGDRLHVWESTQSVSGVRRSLAKAYGLPEEDVRVVCEFMGGGFGAKFGPYRYTHLAVFAARRLGRPVRLVLDRHEENLATGNRPATVQTLKIGAKRDGTLTALELTAVSLWGAGGQGGTVAGPAQVQYACPNLRTTEYGVYVNAGPASAFRAPGYPEGSFALESALDELAHRLGLDPIEVRRKNFPKERPDGRPWSQNSFLEAYEVGARAFGWDRRGPAPDPREIARRREAGELAVVRGLGMAAGMWGSAGWPPAYAWVQVHADGTATVTSGTQDIGTGTKTALALVAAEELGLPVAAVHMRLGDTDMAPFGTGSGGSGTTSSMAPAVRAAAADARRQLAELLAGYFEVRPEEIRIREGRVHLAEGARPSVAVPAGGVALAELLRDVGPINVVGKGGRAPTPGDRAAASVAVHFCEAAVDLETGTVRVERYLAVHESGRVINPLTMTSQIQGGILFGLGYALFEERRLDPRHGWVLNANLESYKVATHRDVPRIETILLDRPDDHLNNAAVKGIGEPPVIPVAAAVANAVFHATGLRFRDLPITPAKVLAALREVARR
ncbi:MAG: xanthine dehydrogenase family protein molybdopterin-binding subunit [Clostridia bacterium]|nr:xanthine dehydrogenase family protein molybdopterin-binding subunit [Clostridia bacterium]